jgi:hypothetical protein
MNRRGRAIAHRGAHVRHLGLHLGRGLHGRVQRERDCAAGGGKSCADDCEISSGFTPSRGVLYLRVDRLDPVLDILENRRDVIRRQEFEAK